MVHDWGPSALSVISPGSPCGYLTILPSSVSRGLSLVIGLTHRPACDQVLYVRARGPGSPTVREKKPSI